MRLVTIGSYVTPEEAHVAKNHLENEGIQAVLADEFTAGFHPVRGDLSGGVKLQVREEDAERATQLLQAARRGAGEQEPDKE